MRADNTQDVAVNFGSPRRRGASPFCPTRTQGRCFAPPWRTKVRRYTLIALLALVGCRETAHDEPKPAHPEHDDDHGAETAAHADDDLLRIDPAVLRDIRVTTSPAEARSGGEGVTVLGEIRVDENAYAEVGFAAPARVSRLVASVGDTVEPGSELAVLHSSDLGQARAELVRAQARLRLAQQALGRKRDLAAEQIVPRREVEEAEAAAAAADAEVKAAEATLTSFGGSSRTTPIAGAPQAEIALRSPIAGVVIDRQAVLGQRTDPAKPLFLVADLARLWLVVHVFERDAVRIQVGAAARITLPALPGRTFDGRVTLIGKQVEISSRTVPVRLEVDNAEGLFRPGMSATAWIPLQDSGKPIVAVPSAALQRRADDWCVFLPRGEGLFEIRTVGRGRDLGGEVEILNGLGAGETVVVNGAFLLKAEAERARGGGEHHDH